MSASLRADASGSSPSIPTRRTETSRLARGPQSHMPSVAGPLTGCLPLAPAWRPRSEVSTRHT